MSQVNDIVSNPVLRQSLKLVSPQAGLILDLADLAVAFFGGFRSRDRRLKAMIKVLDERIAALLKELGETESDLRRHEIEVTLLELLGVLNEFDRRT